MLGERIIAAVTKREPDFYIGGKERPYIKRWWVIPRNRFFNIYLHHMLRDDDDRALHDHPWINLSIILRGGYIEIRPDRRMIRRRGDVVFRRAVSSHRLVLGHWSRDAGSWSLFITGPIVRQWGFHCPQGWRHWKKFVSMADTGAVGPGCD